ncbi:MAG TPA: class I SAM-dependent methyltransferase [Selenomonadales bacterium]|nr:class I SAM-dependent methyltransferase [Selenomonadales bacterium]
MKQRLTGVSETLLIPLWARATETMRSDAIIKDYQAVRMMDQIEYDFTKFAKTWLSQTGIVIRTELLDKAAANFISRHPDATVVNLGCGLDTRFFRLDNGRIRWYDLDLPEPVRIRRSFFAETERYRIIGKSIFDDTWLKDVDGRDKPVLFIAEGLFMYFTEGEVKGLFAKLIDHFPGAEMLLEILAPLLVKNKKRHDTVGKMDAAFRWGAIDGAAVEKLHSDIRLVQEWNYFDSHRERWRWYRWLAVVPALKKAFNNKIVHLKFA